VVVDAAKHSDDIRHDACVRIIRMKKGLIACRLAKVRILTFACRTGDFGGTHALVIHCGLHPLRHSGWERRRQSGTVRLPASGDAVSGNDNGFALDLAVISVLQVIVGKYVGIVIGTFDKYHVGVIAERRRLCIKPNVVVASRDCELVYRIICVAVADIKLYRDVSDVDWYANTFGCLTDADNLSGYTSVYVFPATTWM